jgi:hypothetical protein
MDTYVTFTREHSNISNGDEKCPTMNIVLVWVIEDMGKELEEDGEG